MPNGWKAYVYNRWFEAPTPTMLDDLIESHADTYRLQMISYSAIAF